MSTISNLNTPLVSQEAESLVSAGKPEESDSDNEAIKRPFDGKDREDPTKRARHESSPPQSRWGQKTDGFAQVLPLVFDHLSLNDIVSSSKVCSLWFQSQQKFWENLKQAGVSKKILLSAPNLAMELRPRELYFDQQFRIFAGGIAKQLPSFSFETVAEARAWIADPENKEALQNIKTKIDFSDSGMKLFITPEINQLIDHLFSDFWCTYGFQEGRVQLLEMKKARK